jgi:hypothetical protein
LSLGLGLEGRLRNGLTEIAERVVEIDRLLPRQSPQQEDDADGEERSRKEVKA